MRAAKFTIYHGFAASFLLHSAIAAPFVFVSLEKLPEDNTSLVVELQGLTATIQADQKIQQQIKGEIKSNNAEKTKLEKVSAQSVMASEERPRKPPMDDLGPAATQPKQNEPAPAKSTTGNGGTVDQKGSEQQQNAQTIRPEREEIYSLKAYIKGLSKKVQVKLVYPEEGRQAGLQGTAIVSFTIFENGQVPSDSLKIITSSHQPKLDTSALKTIRASAPFDPPPRKITVSIAVAFGHKR